MTSVNKDPFIRFRSWFDEAQNCDAIKDPTAMCLATANRKAAPSARIVLLKTLDEQGFVFFTNWQSRKSHDMDENQAVALCFYWPEINKQVRVEGHVEKTSSADSDAYFKSRPRESQIGAWASNQSQELNNRAALEKRFAEYKQHYEGCDVPRPENWGGWRVIPSKIEFWEAGAHRLHTRELYIRSAHGWEQSLLYP